jgi:hypothetical protein
MIKLFLSICALILLIVPNECSCEPPEPKPDCVYDFNGGQLRLSSMELTNPPYMSLFYQHRFGEVIYDLTEIFSSGNASISGRNTASISVKLKAVKAGCAGEKTTSYNVSNFFGKVQGPIINIQTPNNAGFAGEATLNIHTDWFMNNGDRAAGDTEMYYRVQWTKTENELFGNSITINGKLNGKKHRVNILPHKSNAKKDPLTLMVDEIYRGGIKQKI